MYAGHCFFGDGGGILFPAPNLAQGPDYTTFSHKCISCPWVGTAWLLGNLSGVCQLVRPAKSLAANSSITCPEHLTTKVVTSAGVGCTNGNSSKPFFLAPFQYTPGEKKILGQLGPRPLDQHSSPHTLFISKHKSEMYRSLSVFLIGHSIYTYHCQSQCLLLFINVSWSGQSQFQKNQEVPRTFIL